MNAKLAQVMLVGLLAMTFSGCFGSSDRDAPGAPAALQKCSPEMTETGVCLTWEPPAAKPTGYLVYEYRAMSEPRVLIAETKATSLELPEVTPGEHTYAVTAYNGDKTNGVLEKIEGLPSEPIVVAVEAALSLGDLNDQIALLRMKRAALHSEDCMMENLPAIDRSSQILETYRTQLDQAGHSSFYGLKAGEQILVNTCGKPYKACYSYSSSMADASCEQARTWFSFNTEHGWYWDYPVTAHSSEPDPQWVVAFKALEPDTPMNVIKVRQLPADSSV